MPVVIPEQKVLSKEAKAEIEAKKMMAEEGIVVDQDLSKESKIKEAEAEAAKEAE